MNTNELMAMRQIEVQAAKSDYEKAVAQMQLANIHYRLAHIDSQPEPLDGLVKADLTDRERMVAAAYFVVVGQVPEIKPKEKPAAKDTEKAGKPKSGAAAGGKHATEEG